MILNVTFPYGAHVRAPRQRNARYRGFLGTVPVEIPEATDAEAPVALRVRKKDEPAIDYRLHAGRLWTAHDKGVRDAAWLVECATNDWRHSGWVVLGNGHSQDYYKERYAETDDLVPVERDPSVAAVVRSNAEERAAAVRETAADLLVVDGVLHKAAAEPLYVMHKDYVAIDHFDRRSYSDDIIFRADERGYMADFPRQMTQLPRLPFIEVLDPAAVRAPMPHLALLDEAHGPVFEVGENHKLLKNMDIPYFTLYAALRDAVEAGRASVAEQGAIADLEDVVSAMERFLDAYEDRQQESGRPLPGYDSHRRDFAAALERYRSFRAEAPDLGDRASPGGPR